MIVLINVFSNYDPLKIWNEILWFEFQVEEFKNKFFKREETDARIFLKYLKRHFPKMTSDHPMVYETDFRFPGLRVIHCHWVDRMTNVAINEWVDQILAGLLVYIDSIIHIGSLFAHLMKKKSGDKKVCGGFDRWVLEVTLPGCLLCTRYANRGTLWWGTNS